MSVGKSQSVTIQGQLLIGTFIFLENMGQTRTIYDKTIKLVAPKRSSMQSVEEK